MSDICERLRKEIPWEQEIAEQLEEAIAEIERLRKRDALWQWCAERTTETYGGCYRPEYAEKVEAAAREFAADDATGSE